MRPNVDLAFSMLRSGQCGHLCDPSPEQVERARDVIAETYSLPGSVAMERIGRALGLKACTKTCCKPKRNSPDKAEG